MYNKLVKENKFNEIIDDNKDMIDLLKELCCSVENAIDSVEDIEIQKSNCEQEIDIKVNLKKMLKKDLITLAKQRGCKVKSRMTKAQLIKAIQETI